MIDVTQIQKHMEVVGSDGQHVGSVDNVGIKLTKSDPAAHGQHHYLKLEYVSLLEAGKLVLSISGAQAQEELKAVDN